MKKVIFLGIIALAVVTGMFLPASALANEAYTIIIHKIIPEGGPQETFTFNVYRDINNNGIIDEGDILVGYVVINTAITVTNEIIVPWQGPYVIHEELSTGSAYQQLDDQATLVPDPETCGPAEVTFTNELGELGKIKILKVDEENAALAEATFVITPDPKTGIEESSLTVIDNVLNDEDGTTGTLLVTNCLIGITCTVTETVPPPGYDTAPPQTVTLTSSTTVTLTFINHAYGTQGCTPGFWKNHPDLWVGYNTDSLIGDVFDIPAELSDLADDTLIEALNYGGGKGTIGAARNLLRHAVAALLNASHPHVNYTMTDNQIINAVNLALASLDRDTIEELKNQLDTYNNAGCSIDAHGNPINGD